ncbi:GNAT domain-containing protein [Pestalotiopsis sp. NC0098]|nr:GNAT domain-containing protein [Pestalotiopsis sp. NC0098]
MSQSDIPMLRVHYSKESHEEGALLPWFSYRVTLPLDPLPDIASRPHIRTERLLIRPLLTSDTEAFYKLRSDPELQQHSIVRGLPDATEEQTRSYIESLQSPGDESHWYFGAFLASTGELIGEGGLPDTECRKGRTGWPEPDFLIAREYQRQGYGTEFYKAVMDSWWKLPRERRRRQLHPFAVPGIEAGAKLVDHVAILYESSNEAADAFFTKMTSTEKVTLAGTSEEYDMREGRPRELINWSGMNVTNPVPFVDPEEEEM